MKPMKTKSTRRLRARAAAMNTHDADFEDYGPEPNMKLSHAFLVVLLLHVIAVGGLYAFNSMKAGKASKIAVASSTTPTDQQVDPSNDSNQSGEKGQKNEDPGKHPSKEKTPVVAKTSEAPKTSENASLGRDALKPKPHQGMLASAKAAFLRLTGIGIGGGGIATASAQDATPGQTAENTPALPATDSAPAPTTYVVKAGDTITRIASSLGVTIPNLEKANGLVGSAVLHVGQTLKVPEQMVAQASGEVADQATQVAGSVQQLPGSIAAAATAATSGVASAVGSTPTADTAGLVEYTVVKGDSPYKIAKKYKITPDELMKANGITDPKKIQIGQKLKIPASNKKTAQPAA
jgi:LysM repeat protein